MKGERLDAAMVARGLAPSRNAAQGIILAMSWSTVNPLKKRLSR